MIPVEQELRGLFRKLIPTASARCVFARPPHRREVCGFRLYYKKTLVREYFSKRGDKGDLPDVFRVTCEEKGLFL